MKDTLKKIICFCLCVITFIHMPTSVSGAITNYYGQLNKVQKEIYNEMYKKLYEADEESLYIDASEFDDSIKEYSSSQYMRNVNIAYSSLINDNPGFYWNGTLATYQLGENLYWDDVLVYKKISGYKVHLKSDTMHNKSEKNKFHHAFMKATKKIQKKAGKKSSKIRLLKAINAWIASNTKYASKYAINYRAKYTFIHNAYGVFVKKKAVCDGYSMAFKMLCDYFEIPCMVIYGSVLNSSGQDIAHMWNVVRYKKKWYFVDVTWNDTGTENLLKWFLVGKKSIKKTHILQTKRADVLNKGYFSYPLISKKDFKASS